MPKRRLFSLSALSLALLAGVSSLVVIVAIGYSFQRLLSSKNLQGDHLFWLENVAGPLAVATFIGVLLSRVKNTPRISLGQSVATVALAPIVAFCAFVVAYLVSTSFPNHYTPRIVDSILLLGYASVVVAVRFLVNVLCRIYSSAKMALPG